MKVDFKDIEKMTELGKPLIKWLNENFHPHCSIVITPTSIELIECVMKNPNIEDYIQD